MKYERLTMKTINGYGISGELVIQKQPAVDIAIDSFDIVINRLAELEDKIERGELVENKVVTYINMARSDSKTLIDKAIKYDKLKNKIENGTLVELPCKVGDTVYKQYINEIESFRVTMICQKADKTFKIRLTSDRYKTSHDVLISELGKTVFLTKAEAEQKLKELKDENK